MLKNILEYTKKHLLFLFITNQVILLVITMLAFYTNLVDRNNLTTIAILLNILSVFLYLFVCIAIKQQSVQQADISLYEKHVQLQKEYQSVKDNNFIIVQQLHDTIFNQLSTQDFTYYNEDEARKYANNIINENISIYQTDFCQNQIVDAILYNKTIVAKENKTDFSINVYLPNNINIETIDLISLYTNLIDNALEATSQLSHEKRFINIDSRIYLNHLIIKITNSINYKKINDDLTTTKKDNESHGLGLLIIKNILSKYNGILDIEKDTNSITFNVSLELK